MKVTYFNPNEEYNLSVDYSKMMSEGWSRRLKDFLHGSDMSELMFSVDRMYRKTDIMVFPPKHEIFSIFNKLDLTEINVAIINCSPSFNQRSNGIAFANRVNDRKNYDIPLVSLFDKINIYERNGRDLSDLDLEHWIEQYVFLMNVSLTGFSNHHQRAMWFGFTRKVLKEISGQRQGVIFMFIGSPENCRPYMAMVNHGKHSILRSDTLSYDALNDINSEIDGIDGKSYRIKW